MVVRFGLLSRPTVSLTGPHSDVIKMQAGTVDGGVTALCTPATGERVELRESGALIFCGISSGFREYSLVESMKEATSHGKRILQFSKRRWLIFGGNGALQRRLSGFWLRGENVF